VTFGVDPALAAAPAAIAPAPVTSIDLPDFSSAPLAVDPQAITNRTPHSRSTATWVFGVGALVIAAIFGAAVWARHSLTRGML
jgi:hypothetical protein